VIISVNYYWKALVNYIAGEKKYVKEDQLVTLECRAVLYPEVIWWYTPTTNYVDTDNRIIYWPGRIEPKDRKRLRVSRPEKGIFDLDIHPVIASDAGVYRCIEEGQPYPGETCTELILIRKSMFIHFTELS